MKTLLGIFALAVALGGGSITAKLFADDDTIFITAEPSSRFKRHAPPEANNEAWGYDSVVMSSRCTTMRGKQGTCRSINECYPILFPLNRTTTGNTGLTTTAKELITILVEVSGICDKPRNMKPRESVKQVLDAEFLICCPDPAVFSLDVPKPPPVAEDLYPETVIEGLETFKDQQMPRTCGKVHAQPTPTLKPGSGNDTQPSNKTLGQGDRVVGGQEAPVGGFPWIVSFMNRGRLFCAGSLISNSWVLTAAHCVSHMGASDIANLRLIFGDHDLSNPNDVPTQTKTATQVLYHKHFTMQKLQNDIGLIKLSSPVQYTRTIQPVCLHTGGGGSIENMNADLAGWGQICEGCTQPSKLRAGKLTVLPHSECRRQYAGIMEITEGMLCGGGKVQSCRGDSGGALTLASKTNPEQIGLVSFGVECGSRPGVFTRIEKYMDWINKNQRNKL